jgi:CheY-like chemotaxis protein
VRKLTTALVADDNRIERMILREIFIGIGAEVIEAANGDEAVEAIEERIPDVIVSDLLMPKRDGFELATWVGEQELDPRPLLILTSAVYKTGQWKRELKENYFADHFLPKPVNPEELRDLLSSHFEIDVPGGD